jgi:O-succinylbenzoate synthase
MRIVAASARRLRWPIAPVGAARGHTDREALIVAVRADDGATGLGEAAPLAGMSIDDIERAARAVDELAARLPIAIDSPGHATDIAESITTAPAARFALETALLAAFAQHARTSLASLWGNIPQRELQYGVVVDDEHDARAAASMWLKVKVGAAPFAADLERVRRIARAAPGARLRLDANRAWSQRDALVHLRELRDLAIASRDSRPASRSAEGGASTIDYVEEPCPAAHELLDRAPALRIALDESLIALPQHELVRALRSPHLAALVLKPTLLGGFVRCFAIAASARAHDVPPVVSHTLEGPVGTAACAELARAIGANVPVGLAPHPALARWSEAT